MSKRADRIKEQVPILDVLSKYGYDVHGYNREQQFKCDLHGDGSDNAPSARVYPETGSWFCFACGKARDVISTVMEKEGLDFSSACRAIELKYGLEEWKILPKRDIFADAPVEQVGDVEMIQRRVRLRLEDRLRERVSLEESLKHWEAYNMLSSIDATVAQWVKLYRVVQ